MVLQVKPGAFTLSIILNYINNRKNPDGDFFYAHGPNRVQYISPILLTENPNTFD